MTTYTAIADSEIDPESPGTTSLFTRLRDNPIAQTEGAAGAPKIQGAAIDTDTITAANIAPNAVGSSELSPSAVSIASIDSASATSFSSGDLKSDLSAAIVTGSINGWTNVTVTDISIREFYIDSNATNLLIRILYNSSGSSQSIDSRITVDGTLSNTITTAAVVGWKWSGFHTINISAKSGWHNIDTLELRPVSFAASGYDIAGIQYYLS